MPRANATVLLVEDHQDIAEMVTAALESEGYEVDYAADGLTGLHLAATNRYDTIVLDLMLPGMDGIELCRKLRTDAGDDVPVLMLTARDTIDDKLTGFDVGADDYLVKPFDVKELLARVEALVRRKKGEIGKSILRVGDLSLNPDTMEVSRGGDRIMLSRTTFNILAILMRRSPAVVSRSELESELWRDGPPDSDALRTHIYNLRKAVDKPYERALIQTIPATGFRVVDEDG